MMLKLKYVQNSVILDITNSALDIIISDPKEVLGILDLRSLGYYKIKEGILQQNLSKYYRFKKTDILCKQFNKFINTLKKERKEETKEKYVWLDSSNKRKYMTDREILEKEHRFRKVLFNRKKRRWKQWICYVKIKKHLFKR